MPPALDVLVYQIDRVSSIASTITHIETDAEGRFKLLYVGFGVAGTYEGTNLLAVRMDSNNQIVPIGTGVCQGGESTKAWSFFLSKLKESIGVVQDMTAIYDRHLGIVNACATIFPNAFHGLFTILQGFKPRGFLKLLAADLGIWSRAYCPTDQYNYMTSNNTECINSLTKDIHKLPITRLVDRQRETLQNWFTNRREKYKDAAANELTEWVAAKVHRRKLKGAKKTPIRETYTKLVYPLQGPSSWETPTDKQNMLPPTMEKQMPR
nr:hypothetical protein [Tanacetum cinerariifolium]